MRRPCRQWLLPDLMGLNNLAYTFASDQDVALKYAQQAAEIAPDSVAVQDTLGWIYHRKAIFAGLPATWRGSGKGANPRGGSFIWRCPT
jgi:hypothetical protein